MSWQERLGVFVEDFFQCLVRNVQVKILDDRRFYQNVSKSGVRTKEQLFSRTSPDNFGDVPGALRTEAQMDILMAMARQDGVFVQVVYAGVSQNNGRFRDFFGGCRYLERRAVASGARVDGQLGTAGK